MKSEIASKLKLFAPLKVAYEGFLYNSVTAFFDSFTPARKIFKEHLKIAWRLNHETLYVEKFHANFLNYFFQFLLDQLNL